MGDSRVTKFEEMPAVFLGGSAGDPAPRVAPAAPRAFREWPLIRPLSSMVRGIRDTVDHSLDAVRGRYDL